MGNKSKDFESATPYYNWFMEKIHNGDIPTIEFLNEMIRIQRAATRRWKDGAEQSTNDEEYRFAQGMYLMVHDRLAALEAIRSEVQGMLKGNK